MIGFTSTRTWMAGGVLALAAALGSGAAQATPVFLNLDTSANFSLVHQGSDPAGSGGPENYLRFKAGERLELEFDGQMLTLFDGITQSFQLESDGDPGTNTPVTTGTLDVIAFLATLDSSTNGFAGGSLTYSLTSNGNIGNNGAGGMISGVFTFEDRHFGGNFNSASIDAGELTLALWGGDAVNDAGIDIVGSGTIPEPGTTALLSFGLAGFIAARRRRRNV